MEESKHTAADRVEAITSLIVGNWAVMNDAGAGFDPRFEAKEIVAVTEKTVTVQSTWRRAHRQSKDNVCWAGSYDDAARLVERLNSSVGLMKDEVRRSKERMAARNADLIARASNPKGEA